MLLQNGDESSVDHYERATGYRVDTAFPQAWFDKKNDELEFAGLCVHDVYAGWVYSPDSIFGEALTWMEVTQVLARCVTHEALDTYRREY